MSRHTLVVCSGGLDSVTLAHLVGSQGRLGGLLGFDYGQRHLKELEFAGLAAERLGTRFERVDLRGVSGLLADNALTGAADVPDGAYDERNMRITVVPNRNAIMLTVAFAAAVAHDFDSVAIAVHGGDHFVYADCRPSFIEGFAAMQRLALDGIANVELEAPFVEIDKHEIVRIGAGLGLPFDQTWSCYRGGALHCGRCATCIERRRAFDAAGITDPTRYAGPAD